MSNVLKIGTTAAKLEDTPFSPGFNAAFFNPAGTAITVQGSQDGVTYTTLINAVADHLIQINSLPKYIKTASGTGYLLSGSTG